MLKRGVRFIPVCGRLVVWWSSHLVNFSLVTAEIQRIFWGNSFSPQDREDRTSHFPDLGDSQNSSQKTINSTGARLEKTVPNSRNFVSGEPPRARDSRNFAEILHQNLLQASFHFFGDRSNFPKSPPKKHTRLKKQHFPQWCLCSFLILGQEFTKTVYSRGARRYFV